MDMNMEQCGDIKTFRIGNEIQVKWPILTNGEPVSLSGRRLTLYLSDQWGHDRKIDTFGTEGNVIVWTFTASEQFRTGVYRLTLFENEGREHQTACDYCFAFRLVPHSCDIPASMDDSELPLDSTDMDVGIHGLSAYEIAVNHGYEGSEEQWMEEFNTVLNSTTFIMESVEKAERVLARTEALYEELDDIHQAEQVRVGNEEARALAEQGREQTETQRGTNEAERQRQEQLRQDQESVRAEAFSTFQQQWSQAFAQGETERQEAFGVFEGQRSQTFAQSEAARQGTFESSEASRSQTFTQSEAERQHSYETAEGQRESRVTTLVTDVETAESQRATAETARAQSETDRAGAETTRRQNESVRQENEATRSRNESYRRSQENLRGAAEQERVEAELLRQRAETARLRQDDAIQEAETLRSAAETRRVASENERIAAEGQRASAETLRASAEGQRATAEQQRESDTRAAIGGIETQIRAKHGEYLQMLSEAVAAAQTDVAAAIDDFRRTHRVSQTAAVVEIQPNVKNVWATPLTALAVTFAEGVAGYDNEYMLEFTVSGDSFTLTLPAGVVWYDVPDWDSGYTYEVSVLDNRAVAYGWETSTI